MSGAVGVALAVGRGLLYFVTVLIFAFYMTADGPRMRRAICSRLPRARQEIVLDTWEIAIEKTGGYLYSRGIQAAISAFVTWAFLLALSVPYSLALGLWVGIVSQFIPTVGTYIAMVLPVLVAFKQDPADALYVLAFLVLYQQFENYILGPRVTKHSMNVHPALAIGTVFAGGLLLGGVGAILALPATAVIQAIISGYTTEREIIDAPLVQEPVRTSRLERLRKRFRRQRRRRLPSGNRRPGRGQLEEGVRSRHPTGTVSRSNSTRAAPPSPRHARPSTRPLWPAATSTWSTSATWFAAVPRTWRTPSSDVVQAVDVGLAEEAAVGVDRQRAVEVDVAVGDEVLRLAPLAEAERLELVEDDRAEVLVEHRHVDVVGPEPRSLPELAAEELRFGEHREIGVVVVVHHAPVAEMRVGRGLDAHRRLRKVAAHGRRW